MKVKQHPGDFRVDELTDVAPGPAGDFAFYRLAKSGWTTPDAVAEVRRRWGLDRRRVSYGGLKDRHAETTQYFTVYRGPRRDLAHARLRVTYLGQVAEPFVSARITANRFAITLRDLTAEEEATAVSRLAEVSQAGLPNYFDDQRFGSVGLGGAFVARDLVAGRFEAALRLALTGATESDRAAQKREKELLRRHWGDWPTCRARLPAGHAREIVGYLATHPTDFRGAVARLHPDLQGLHLAAYQSHLWNRMLDRWLRSTFPADRLGTVRLRLGEVAVPLHVPAELTARWENLTLPLPSARQRPDPGAEWAAIAEAVVAEEGLTLAALKVPGLRKPFFSKGDRAGCVRPAGLTWETGADESNRGRRRLTLRFDLPRGSYATLLVKRVTSPGPGTPGR